jgi:hypothetical protein
MRHRRTLIVTTNSHVRADVLARAIVDAIDDPRAGIVFVEILIPAVLPPTLPITACPPRIFARLGALQDVAGETLRSHSARGRVAISPCRSVPDLLRAAEPADMITLVGPASWLLRRAVRGLAGELVTTTPSPPPNRGRPAPVVRPAPPSSQAG